MTIDDLVDEYATIAGAIKVSEQRKGELRLQILDYMAEHGEPHIRTERGSVAERRDGQAPASYDLISMSHAHPEDIITLAGLGALRMDLATLKSLKGKTTAELDAQRYRIPGGERVTLMVKEPPR
jgi:hypothetical protein